MQKRKIYTFLLSCSSLYPKKRAAPVRAARFFRSSALASAHRAQELFYFHRILSAAGLHARAGVNRKGRAARNGFGHIPGVQPAREEKGTAQIPCQVPVKAFSRAADAAVEQHIIRPGALGCPNILLGFDAKGLDNRFSGPLLKRFYRLLAFMAVQLCKVNDALCAAAFPYAPAAPSVLAS